MTVTRVAQEAKRDCAKIAPRDVLCFELVAHFVVISAHCGKCLQSLGDRGNAAGVFWAHCIAHSN